MRKLLVSILALIASALPLSAQAYIQATTGGYYYVSPDTLSSAIAATGGCVDYTFFFNAATNVENMTINCAGTMQTPQIYPVLSSDVQGLSAALAAKFNNPSGTSAQYIDGTGALQTFPSIGSRSFNYPSRALNSCFQISSTKDADFHYKVDVTGSLSLTSGATGTVTATSYTNSGCSSGAQVVADGASAQSGTLVVGLGITQAISIGIDGTLPAGKWLKLTTANTVGTPTFAIRAVQSEVIQP